MKIRRCYLLIFLFFSENLLSQNEHHNPIKIEERTEKIKEYNSKKGVHHSTNKYLVIIYDDGVTEKATKSKLNEIFKSVPLAHSEYKKYKRNNIYLTGTIPLIGVGFLGTVNALHGKDKKNNTLLAVLGFASSATFYEIFDHRKKRNINRLIAHCNNYWKNKNQQSEINPIVPDVLKLGVVNENFFGVSLIWQISE